MSIYDSYRNVIFSISDIILQIHGIGISLN